MKFKISISGDRETRAELRRLRRLYPKVFRQEQRQEGEDIMRVSKKIVPKDLGNLEVTGTVKGPKPSDGLIPKVTLSFGGPRAPYAVIQHERTDFQHTPPRQAKYLEQPALAARGGMAGRIALRMRARVR